MGRREKMTVKSKENAWPAPRAKGMRLWERKYLSLRGSSVLSGELDFN